MTTTILFKRLLACIYELLILLAICMLVTLIFIACFGDATAGMNRLVLQCLLYGTVGAYFVWSWVVRGQTVAMRAWRLKLVDEAGDLVSTPMAIRRYCLASVLMLTGVSIVWALFDQEHLLLHDRLMKTKVQLLSK